VPVPLLRLADVEREIGGVAVEVLGAGEIIGRQAVAMDPADPLDLGSVVAGRESPSLVAYRFKPLPAREPRTLAVDVVRYATQAVVVANIDEARYQVLSTEDGKTLVRARFAVRNNHRSLLSAVLPADAVLWSTSVAGRFKLVIPPGSFRAEPYAEPVTAVLRDAAMPPSVAASSPPVQSLKDASKTDLDALLQSARRVGGRVPGILPLDVAFPDFGATVYLAAELTPEMQLAQLDLEFERSRGN
jgi:hypothetical protein